MYADSVDRRGIGKQFLSSTAMEYNNKKRGNDYDENQKIWLLQLTNAGIFTILLNIDILWEGNWLNQWPLCCLIFTQSSSKLNISFAKIYKINAFNSKSLLWQFIPSRFILNLSEH